MQASCLSPNITFKASPILFLLRLLFFIKNIFVFFIVGNLADVNCSWKDIKYFAKYVKDKTSDSYHPLIIHVCKLLSSQLEEDWEFCTDYFVKAKDPEMKNDNVNLSLAARWCPREPNYKQKKNIKFGFMYQTIADIMFPHFLESTSPDNKESWKRAKTKCRIHLKKRITTMNKHLDTTQIKL